MNPLPSIESADEEDREPALELRDAWLSGHCSMVLPALWVFEVGNILGMKQSTLAPQLVQILIDSGIEEEDPQSFYGKALELMKAYKVTFYAAAYHAVSALGSEGKHSAAIRQQFGPTLEHLRRQAQRLLQAVVPFEQVCFAHQPARTAVTLAGAFSQKRRGLTNKESRGNSVARS